MATVFVWGWLLHPKFGLVNATLRLVGLPPGSWLSEPGTALATLIALSLWGIGLTMVIFLAGLQGVPESLYDAGKIDGANERQLFWHITLPQLSPTMFFVLITGMIGTFQYFIPAFILTKGGPVFATYFYNLNLYEKAFRWQFMGLASAMAWLDVRDHPCSDTDPIPDIRRLGVLRGEAMRTLQEPISKFAHASAAYYARQRRRNRIIHGVFVYSVLAVLAFVFLLPLLWMLLSAVKTRQEVLYFPPTIIPRELHLANFAEAWNFPGMEFWRWTLNTVIISATVLIGVLLTSSLCAYGFARIRFPGRDFWFIATIASIMLPPQVTIIPLYIFFYKIGWLNTLKPLIIPAWFGGGALNIFLLRQFFLQIPVELEDAAYIDGASRLQIWWRIFLPAVAPGNADGRDLYLSGNLERLLWPADLFDW